MGYLIQSGSECFTKNILISKVINIKFDWKEDMIKLFYSLAFLMLACFPPLVGLDPTSSNLDRKEISQLISQFAEKWNQHNPQEMANFWSEDGDLLNPWGIWAKGRNEVEQIFIQEQTGSMKNSHMQQTIQDIRMLAPNVAWVDGNAHITGVITHEGQSKTFDFHVVFLLVKQNNQWRIKAGRPYLLQGPLTRPVQQ